MACAAGTVYIWPVSVFPEIVHRSCASRNMQYICSSRNAHNMMASMRHQPRTAGRSCAAAMHDSAVSSRDREKQIDRSPSHMVMGSSAGKASQPAPVAGHS